MTDKISRKNFGENLWCNFALMEDYALDCLQEVPEHELEKIAVSHFVSRFLCKICAEKFKKELKFDKNKKEEKVKRISDKSSQEVEDFLLKNAENMYIFQIQDSLYFQFDLKLTYTGIRLRLKKLGINHKSKRPELNEAEKIILLKFLAEKSGQLTARQMVLDLQKEHNLQMTEQSVREYCKRNNFIFIPIPKGRRYKK